MSIQEKAAELRNLASLEHARSMLAELKADVEGKVQMAAMLLGNHAGLSEIQGAAGQVESLADQVMQAIGALGEAITGVADRIQQG
ncbi:hypothetical protein SD37_11650 [Amycolatopsis orientalis]|uniref:Uncharacterized protein n=1 Tax=Amycolatopsis orientalis TaxID=31958 RepID=A0A193BVI3_AMYOR|nr:hypothetical protein SD37_11650 [Amycolatopsis orientalis]